MSATSQHVIAAVVLGGLTFGAAWFGASFPPGEWHAALTKPSWNPPNWIFGPVWTFLYLSMAVAAWLVWKESGLGAAAGPSAAGPSAAVPLAFFVAQLVLNAAWSWLFFGLHRMDLALIDIIALLVLIVITCVLFWRVSTIAGLLFVPYILWVTFAAALNVALWRLNP